MDVRFDVLLQAVCDPKDVEDQLHHLEVRIGRELEDGRLHAAIQRRRVGVVPFRRRRP
jgi:hypothetical protein